MSKLDDNPPANLSEQEQAVAEPHDLQGQNVVSQGSVNARDIYAQNVVSGNQYNYYYYRMTSPHVPQGPLFMAADLPTDFVARPREFAALKQSLLQEQQQGLTAITSTLVGAGGYGKTTLALALCHDADVRAQFHGGILWITLGDQPINLVNKINDLIYLLQGEYPNINNLEIATTALKNALADRPCLLVIDDVWRDSDLKPFLQGAPQCARLVTTRNHQVLPPITQHVPVDAMSQDEAALLLQAGIETNTASEHQQETIRQLASLLGEWPLLLTLANGVLRDRVLHLHEPLTAALIYLQQALEKRGVVAFDASNAKKREEAVALTLEVSLLQLDTDERKRYEELAIFPEDVNIPLAAVSRFWRATGHFDVLDTEALCQRLANLSLLLRCNLSSRHIQLHDTIRRYLRTRVAPHLVTFNQQFLDAYTLVHWADLTQEEEYLWDFLVQHLCQAERWKELHTTFTDVRFLAKKVLVRGVVALEEDLLQAWNAAQAWQERHEPVPDAATWLTIQRRIGQISHLISQVHTLSEIGGVLLAHLGWETYLQGQRRQAKTLFASPFLTAWHPLPARSSSALLRTFTGHTDKVTACAFSPNGRWIASASADKTLRVGDAISGAKRFALIGHAEEITDCAFSPDGRLIVTASADKTLKVWDSASGKERLPLIGHADKVNACVFSPDSCRIVSASDDKTLRVWDATSGDLRFSLTGHTDKVTACTFSPDGRFIISASNDGTLKFWDATSGTERSSITTGQTIFFFSPDNRWIVSTSDDNTLHVWGDVASGKKPLTLAGHTDKVNICAFSPDSRWIVSASDDKTLRVWDVISGKERLILAAHTDKVRACAFSPDSRWIVSASDDKTLRVWDATYGIEHFLVENTPRFPSFSATSPDGHWIVLAGGHTPRVRGAGVNHSAEGFTLIGHTDFTTGCAFSSDGSTIITASDDGTLKIWDASSGIERFSLIGHTSRITAWAFSFDKQSIVSADKDGTLKVWDASSGIERFSLIGHTTKITTCAFSFDGSTIVSVSADKTLKVWDASSGVEQLSFITNHTREIRACAFSFDGRWIASASEDKTLKVWDTTSGFERLSLITNHTGEIRACAFSFDGGTIVTSSVDRTLKVWDTTSGKERLSPTDDHTSRITACAFSSDGRSVVSADKDGTLQVWDASTGKKRVTLMSEDDIERRMLYDFDEGRLTFTSLKKIVKTIWSLNTDDDIHSKLMSLQETVEMIRDFASGKKHTDDEWSHTIMIDACVFSPDGRFIVTASKDETLRIWDASSPKKYRILDSIALLNTFVFSPNGRFIITGSKENETRRVWDTSTGKERFIFSDDSIPLTAGAISPDGRFVVFASQKRETLDILDTSTGKERFTFSGHSTTVTNCAISPDGRWIVSASLEGPLKVWDASTGKVRLTLIGHPDKRWPDMQTVTDCTFSPDGHFIITASKIDETLKVWDAASGVERFSLEGYVSSVHSYAVSPNSHFIVYVSGDHSLKVGDLRTGACLLTFPIDEDLRICAFHPDGEHLVAWNDQGIFFLRLVQ
jgi:WD40 repeat protein